MRKNHYKKAAEEIIKAVKEIADYSLDNPLTKLDFHKGKKLIIKMLKANFTAKKKWV
jgi:hypothetical protein